MGKNKKWKRKAKRIYGECCYRDIVDCHGCPYDINGECDGIRANTDGYLPITVGIRTIERICKDGE